MTCNTHCAPNKNRCKSSYKCKGKYQTNCSYSPTIVALDKSLLPKDIHDAVLARKKNKVIRYVQNNSKFYFWTYNFSQMLKFNYNLCGQNKSGCCYKMLWKTYGGRRYVAFNEMIDLYTYMIRYGKTSHLAYYISVVLGSLQTMNVARQMISNSKYYPYQNLVKNRQAQMKNPKSCPCFDQLGYGKKYRNLNMNEYIYWFTQTNIFTPYKRLNIDQYNKYVNQHYPK